jgi:hypothetical protein
VLLILLLKVTSIDNAFTFVGEVAVFNALMSWINVYLVTR